MNIRLFIIIPIVSSLLGCSTLERSTVLGIGIGAASGSAIGYAAKHNAKSALLGGGIGALVAGAMAFFIHKEQEKKSQLREAEVNKNTDKIPSLSTPDVRRIWVPEKIEGSKFIEGHFIYVIEHPTVWSK